VDTTSWKISPQGLHSLIRQSYKNVLGYLPASKNPDAQVPGLEDRALINATCKLPLHCGHVAEDVSLKTPFLTQIFR
jgi:hypothetical protein